MSLVEDLAVIERFSPAAAGRALQPLCEPAFVPTGDDDVPFTLVGDEYPLEIPESAARDYFVCALAWCGRHANQAKRMGRPENFIPDDERTLKALAPGNRYWGCAIDRLRELGLVAVGLGGYVIPPAVYRRYRGRQPVGELIEAPPQPAFKARSRRSLKSTSVRTETLNARSIVAEIDLSPPGSSNSTGTSVVDNADPNYRTPNTSLLEFGSARARGSTEPPAECRTDDLTIAHGALARAVEMAAWDPAGAEARFEHAAELERQALARRDLARAAGRGEVDPPATATGAVS